MVRSSIFNLAKSLAATAISPPLITIFSAFPKVASPKLIPLSPGSFIKTFLINKVLPEKSRPSLPGLVKLQLVIIAFTKSPSSASALAPIKLHLSTQNLQRIKFTMSSPALLFEKLQYLIVASAS